jgi:arsenical pump membrane protein
VHAAADAARQVWPAFALVTGLLLVGVVAEGDGLFRWAGALLARLPLGARGLLAAAFALVAVVTALLNLDTAVFFLTPVLVHLARARGLDEAPFLYGAVFMSNAASLYLPGSNLTNLIVLHGEHVSGATFFARTWAAALAATVVTAALLAVVFRRELARPGSPQREWQGARLGVGALAVAAATVLVVLLASPALPVLAAGVLAVIVARAPWTRIAEAVDLRILAGLFALAVLLGAVGRWWHGPASVLGSAGQVGAAAFGAAAAVVVNNLPASVLLTPTPPDHARALLIGLNLGPTLAVTGSLSAFLWLRVARSLGAQPSPLRYTRLGLLVVPVSVAAALAALRL